MSSLSLGGYDPGLYVPRNLTEQQLDHWANQPQVDKRLLSLVSPPGTGKTWLLRNAETRWRGNPPHRVVLWLDVPTVINPKERVNINAMLNDVEILRWLKEAYARARDVCPEITPPAELTSEADLTKIIATLVPSVSRFIDYLVRDLCAQCSQLHQPILIVDGIDEPTKEQTTTLAVRILKLFFGQDCTRMIISHRDAYWITEPTLRRHQKIVKINENDKVLISQQFANGQADGTAYGFHLDDLKSLLPKCKWDHPFINDFLIERAHKNAQIKIPLIQTPNDLDECCRSLVSRAGRHSVPDSAFDLLQRIAKNLPDEWNDIELQGKIGVNIAHSDIRALFANGVIVQREIRYQVADGLRELLRSY